MSNLFAFPKKMPKIPGEVVMYKTSLGCVEKIALDKKLKEYIELFKLRSRPIDYGDSIVFSEKTFELEIFKTSDSMWWEHNKLAHRERVPTDAKLPPEDTAIQLAEKYLKKYRVKIDYAKYSHISYSNLIVMHKKDKKEEKHKTEINVNYSFNLGDIPVEGPGAKAQVSFVERNKLCELYYFWREPTKDITLPIIPPDRALEIFCKDAAFVDLSPSSASVKIHSIDFVYYALPPLEPQRYYLPTYKINGTATTKHHEHHFTNYLIAFDLAKEDIKRKGLLADVNLFKII